MAEFWVTRVYVGGQQVLADFLEECHGRSARPSRHRKGRARSAGLGLLARAFADDLTFKICAPKDRLGRLRLQTPKRSPRLLLAGLLIQGLRPVRVFCSLAEVAFSVFLAENRMFILGPVAGVEVVFFVSVGFVHFGAQGVVLSDRFFFCMILLVG